MSTAGNGLLQFDPRGSEGNSLVAREVHEESVTDPTLGNGDGTFDLNVSGAGSIGDVEYVLGIDWDGTHKVSVDSVSGNTVSVLFESPDGVDSFVNESDGQVTGTLEVRVAT